MGNRLKELRENRGWTHEQAADAMGLSRSGYVKLERGERKLSDRHIQTAAEVYGVPLSDVLGEEEPRKVELRGYVGAGQRVYQFEEGTADYVDAPPNAVEETEAVEVRGESMLPAYRDGAIIYYSRQLAPETMIGSECVLQLDDGRVLVKTLKRGSERGLWTLVSLNADDIEDVAVQWAAPIDWIKPNNGPAAAPKRASRRPAPNIHLVEDNFTAPSEAPDRGAPQKRR